MGKQEFNFKNFTQENRIFIGIYLIWFFLHFVFLLINWPGNTNYFWPFGNSDFDEYDLTEFLLYTIAPIIIYLIYYFLKDDIKKGLEND